MRDGAFRLSEIEGLEKAVKGLPADRLIRKGGERSSLKDEIRKWEKMFPDELGKEFGIGGACAGVGPREDRRDDDGASRLSR